jgi:hypothetical protein
MPGEDFMRGVFRLSPGEFGVTHNHPQLTYYAVHLLFYDPSRDALYAQFGSEDQRKYMMLARADMFRIFKGWIEGIMDDAGIRWKRPPKEERFDRG